MPLVWALIALAGCPQATEAQSTAPAELSAATPGAPQRRLRVATYEDPPFSMKDASGQWSGLVVELWQKVAERMGIEYELVGYDLPDLTYDLINAEKVDVLAAAVPITLDSVQAIEFSSPFLSKVYSIATVPRKNAKWIDALAGPLSHRLQDVLLALLTLFVVASVVIWRIERHRNPAHFGGSMTSGIGNGLWWTATTMTTVGYGDRAPVTTAGRVFAVLVMFLSVILVSVFTGIIASRLTVVELQPKIGGLADLARVRVGVMRGSPMNEFLSQRSIPYTRFPDIERGVSSLLEGNLDAILGGEAELRYLADTRYESRLVVVPGAIDQGFVAFGLRTGSPLRRDINAALLRVLESDEWPRLRQEYLQR